MARPDSDGRCTIANQCMHVAMLSIAFHSTHRVIIHKRNKFLDWVDEGPSTDRFTHSWGVVWCWWYFIN